MTHPTHRLLLAACLLGSFAGPVLAQSTGAPAGMEGATAPGGTEGRAGPRNEAEAIRSGDAMPALPGAGIPVEPAPDGTRAPARHDHAPRP